MNKELIKKYKKEFDHWLDGGNLLARRWIIDGNDGDTSYTMWYSIGCEGWEEDKIFSTSIEYDKTQFIINDEYVKFRKALAEGKTILTNDGGIWEADKTPPSCKFLSPPSHYRIKPDEPKFKVGDWVRHTYNMYTGDGDFTVCTRVLQVLIAEHDVIKCSNGIEFIIAKDVIELWQPQLDEFIVRKFPNNKAIIMRYTKDEKIIGKNPIIEPFIGTLPSFLTN